MAPDKVAPAADGGDAALGARLLRGERLALAKGITLMESEREDHRARAQRLLGELMPHTGNALRIGISGVPGAGKSSFIEALGMLLIAQGHRVAVLVLDPSSSIAGGAILGDKTRMEKLAHQAQAFIRPSPTRGVLGGIGNRTRETLLLCEAAGYDIVIVESVGVGQSETLLAGMTDVFVLLQLSGAGDELQNLKKGVLELADLIVYNKADIDPAASELACLQARSALQLARARAPGWAVPVLHSSALRNEGIAEAWQAICRHRQAMQAAGAFERRRRAQTCDWTWSLIAQGLRERFDRHQGVAGMLASTLDKVADGQLTPAMAAGLLLDRLHQGQR